MSDEEVPFRSMKITLSEEAINRLVDLRQRGAFRSDSATIEECIRVIHDISTDLSMELDSAIAKKQQPIPFTLQAEALKRTIVRIGRFGLVTPRMQRAMQEAMQENTQKNPTQ